jgi:hypothetical protein
MLVWKQWARVKRMFGVESDRKEYKVLLLFGIIPLFIFING